MLNNAKFQLILRFLFKVLNFIFKFSINLLKFSLNLSLKLLKLSLKLSLKLLKLSLLKFIKVLDKIGTQEKQMQITHVEILSDRLKVFSVENSQLLEGEKALRALWFTLKDSSDFNEFGDNKILMTWSVITNPYIEFSYHQNVLINNSTTFEQYWEQVGPFISEKYLSGTYGYSQSVGNYFKVLVWDADHIKNSKIKLTKTASNLIRQDIIKRSYSTSTKNTTVKKGRFITPLIDKKKLVSFEDPTKMDLTKINGVLNTFSTMDIETMEFNGDQVPVAISLSLVSPDLSTEEKFFMIKHQDLVFINGVPTSDSLERAIDEMWLDFINFVKSNKSPSLKTIFVHNLGSFDGLFIFKHITKLLSDSKFTTLIDGVNDFIKYSVTISKGFKINFIDSCRIFPVSLNQLCETMGVPGKTQAYDKAKFNNFNLFKDESALNLFIQYSIQDAKSLAEALIVAQENTFFDYSIDITECLSASNLAMKIFRTKFLSTDIPVLNSWEDAFVRDSYFGGATDVYKAIAKLIHYFDVNSLYPTAMLRDMPVKFLNKIVDPERLKLIDLDDFFYLFLNFIYFVIFNISFKFIL